MSSDLSEIRAIAAGDSAPSASDRTARRRACVLFVFAAGSLDEPRRRAGHDDPACGERGFVTPDARIGRGFTGSSPIARSMRCARGPCRSGVLDAAGETDPPDAAMCARKRPSVRDAMNACRAPAHRHLLSIS